MEPPKSPSKVKLSISGFHKHKWVFKVGLITLFTVFFLLGFYIVLHHKDNGEAFKDLYYNVVVDCGSTGTRVNVYEWMVGEGERKLPILLHSFPDNTTNSPLWRHHCEYHCLQTEPGLDKFFGNSSGVKDSLEPLIHWAEQMVPLEQHSQTPIFVLATAGLRRLAAQGADRVLNDVEAVVKKYRFMYRRSWMRVLSGKEEAYYGWVALNYKLGKLDDFSRFTTSGLLDLGGSSLQVVREMDEIRDDLHALSSKLNSVEHRVLAYSFQALGLNEAFDRTIVMLSRNQSRKSGRGRIELRHPCLSSDFGQSYICNSCPPLEEIELPSYYLTGAPDWEQCKGLASAAAMNLTSAFDLQQPPVGQSCGSHSFFNNSIAMTNLTAIGHRSTSFHALSGFFVVYNNLNLSPIANLTELWESGHKLCSRIWTGLGSISVKQDYG